MNPLEYTIALRDRVAWEQCAYKERLVDGRPALVATPSLARAALSLCGEWGEVRDILRDRDSGKWITIDVQAAGKEVVAALIEELGDTAYGLAAITLSLPDYELRHVPSCELHDAKRGTRVNVVLIDRMTDAVFRVAELAKKMERGSGHEQRWATNTELAVNVAWEELARVCLSLGFEPELVLRLGIEKLEKRHPRNVT